MAYYKNLLMFIAYLFLTGGCFHKSNETGEADDVSHSLLYRAGDGNYLLTHEEIFHATSKSYNRGISQITGYTDHRITIRDLISGKQETRLVTGDRPKDHFFRIM